MSMTLRPLLLLGLGLSLAACADSDTGECCTTLPGRTAEIPTSTTSGSSSRVEYEDSVIQDPAYDCDTLTCVAYHGMPAYCTERCDKDSDCPDGFTCETVLDSDPGPDSAISGDARFCVQENYQCE